MSEHKFTPGPWMWNGAAGVTESKGKPRNRVRVCDVWNNNPELYLNHPDHLVKANANLIAAAPELLEACEKFIAGVEVCTDKELKSRLSYHFMNMSKAIKKALGE